MGSKNNQPIIRFDGFLDNWQQRKLGDIAIEILAGGDIDKSKIVKNGKYPIYANALTNDGIVGYYNDYFRVKAPAITVTGRGDVGYAKVRIDDFTPVVRLLTVRSNHDLNFLENNINNQKIVVESTGVPQLTIPQLAGYNISFPINIYEEIQIGDFFHRLDNLIKLHQRKLDNLQILKKTFLKKIFPTNNNLFPGYRFKEFNDAWEQRKLGEFTDKAVDNRGKTPPIDINGTHPLIEVASLGTGYPDYSKVEKYLNNYAFENNLRGYLKQGDILFSTVGSIGQVSIMDDNEHAAIAQNIVGVRAKEGYVPEYLYSLLSTESSKNKAYRIVMGAVQPSVKVSQLVDIEYLVTENIEEQIQIGAFFRNLNNLITLHQRKIEQLQQMKQYFLKNIFV